MARITLSALFIWIVFPIINYMIWNEVGLRYGIHFDFGSKCPEIQTSKPLHAVNVSKSRCDNARVVPHHVPQQASHVGNEPLQHSSDASFKRVLSSEFNTYKGDEFAKLKYPTPYTFIYNPHHSEPCVDYSAAHVAVTKVPHCIGIVASSNTFHTHNLLRYNADFKKKNHDFNPKAPETTGYFKNVASRVGRTKLRDKIIPFLQGFESIQNDIRSKLEKKGIKAGDDVVLMVANDGEIDLFLNFICSCERHNISVTNVVVFSASR
jgi:hypothetical protein